VKSIVMFVSILAVSVPSLSVSASDGLRGDRVDPLVSLMSEIRDGDSAVIPLESGLVQELFAAPRRTPLVTPTLVLAGSSVKVTVTWKNLYPNANPPTSGTATALQQDDTYGFFYFFDASNPEVLVKVLDGFPDGKYRIFYAGLTTLEFTVNVEVYCGNIILTSKSFTKAFDAPGTSTNTGGTDGTLSEGCLFSPFPLASGVSSVNNASGAISIVGSGSTTVSTIGSTITVSSTGGSSLPSGTSGQTLRFNGTTLAASSALTNNGTDVALTGVLGLPAAVSVTAGGTRFLSSPSSGNLFFGKNAGKSGETGCCHVAVGENALSAHTTNNSVVAVGNGAFRNTTAAGESVAVGVNALNSFVTGYGFAVAVGSSSLESLTSGDSNTALGYNTLGNLTTGASNTVVGNRAGINLTTGSGNVYIGSFGAATESNTTRIGHDQTKTFITGIRNITTGSTNTVAVLIDAQGQLGTASSSRRFKDDIADMGAASERIFELRPVTFRYKAHAGQENATQFGLIAEEVDEVMPGLVARSADREIETVRYQDLPVLLLNELQKMARRVEELEREVVSLRAERDR